MSEAAAILVPLLKGALALWIVMDPLGNVPVFVALTRERTPAERRRVLFLAWVVALIILMVFVVGGRWVLRVFGIELADFEIAGGALLFIIALRMVTRGHPDTGDDGAPGIIPIACPLLVGPGAITTTLVLLGVHRFPIVLGAVLLAFAGTLPVLWFTDVLNRLLGRTGSSVVARIMGIIIAAIGVMYVRQGILAVIR
ncbi:MAG TPA: MarC family protein [Armatimonadota bacterium]|nr:MarC family protein [Armatimonadota bacterium]